MHKLKLKLDLKWLQPYLEAVEHLIRMDKISEIRLIKYGTALPSYHGLIEKVSNNRKYRITLRVYDNAQDRFPISPLDQENILNTLAHELAHVGPNEDWLDDYTVERFVLETKIYRIFGSVLKKLNYEKERNKVK